MGSGNVSPRYGVISGPNSSSSTSTMTVTIGAMISSEQLQVIDP
jgi:hypothetical protein